MKAFDADRRKVDDKTVNIAILRVLLNIEATIEDHLAEDPDPGFLEHVE